MPAASWVETRDSPKAQMDTGTGPKLGSFSGWDPGWGLPVISGLLLRPSRAVSGQDLFLFPCGGPRRKARPTCAVP
jgi:hypothetical protein